jgi:hypothetical protein
MMGLVVVGSGLPDHLSPGTNLPATDTATPKTIHPALAALTPCLHFSFSEAFS